MRSVVLVLPFFLLVGCGSADELQAGEWASEATLESLAAPRMAPEAAERMKMVMGSTISGHRICLTDEMIRNPGADFFSGEGSGCNYQQFTMADGKLDGTMRCTQGARVQTVNLKGTFSASRYDLRMDQTLDAGSDSEMRMVVKVAARRVGDCKPR